MSSSRPSLESRRELIRAHLERFVSENCPEDEVAVLLSGGADSTVVALAAHHVGKRIRAFSFEVVGSPNPDFRQARRTAEIMGWRFEPVEVSTENLAERFLDLFFRYGCRKKTEAECLFPLLDVIQRVREGGFSKALTGFGSFIPDDRRSAIACWKDPEGYWDSCRPEAGVGDSAATVKVIEVAGTKGLEILFPLGEQPMIDALYGLTVKETMGKPYPKHLYKDIYVDDFARLGLLGAESRNLQATGNIEAVFAPLLCDPVIGERAPSGGDRKRRLSALCVRWGRAASLGASARPRVADASPPPADAIGYAPYRMEDVFRASDKNLFTVVSLFAGGGGSSTGYRLAGGRIAFVNEFVSAAVETYLLNYPDTPVVTKDIRKINRGRAEVERLFAQYGVEKGELDILDGSPPCATFSMATAGRGLAKMARKDAAYSDTRQSRIGFLIHDYVFMANVMQPKVCVMENVPGISKSEVFHEALDRLRRYGYLVAYRKLTSSDYGVPQKRDRLIVIAVRPDVARRVGLSSEADVAEVFPRRNSAPITIRQALAGLTIDRSERDLLLTIARQSACYELLKTLPFDPPKHTRMKDISLDWTSDFNLVRAAWDLPCPTITATGAQGRGGIHHPEENRGFTIGELKRLSGLPDDFELSGTFASKAERIGRMVPPLMTKAIAESVYECILKWV